MKKILTPALAALVLAGCSDTPDAGSAAAQPAPTVTVTVTPAPATKTVTKTVTPKSCLQALDRAEEALGLGADALTSSSNVILAVPDLIDAMQYGDLDLLNSVMDTVQSEQEQMDRINAKLDGKANAYNAVAKKCREASD